MKTYNPNVIAPLNTLSPGDTFIEDRELYLVTDIRQNNGISFCLIVCAAVRTGKAANFLDTKLVEPVPYYAAPVALGPEASC